MGAAGEEGSKLRQGTQVGRRGLEASSTVSPPLCLLGVKQCFLPSASFLA